MEHEFVKPRKKTDMIETRSLLRTIDDNKIQLKL